jgi:hypothetical protein
VKAPNSAVETSGGRGTNSSTNTPGENPSKNERDLSRIVALVGGLGLGAMLAFSQALRIEAATYSLHFSVVTVITFVFGFAAAFVYLSRIMAQPERTSRLFVRGGLIVMIFLVLAVFIYPLRFSTGKLTGRLEGWAAAVGVMAAGLTLIRSVVRAAEREEMEQEAKERAASTGAGPEPNVAPTGVHVERGRSDPHGERADVMTAVSRAIARDIRGIAAENEHRNEK